MPIHQKAGAHQRGGMMPIIFNLQREFWLVLRKAAVREWTRPVPYGER